MDLGRSVDAAGALWIWLSSGWRGGVPGRPPPAGVEVHAPDGAAPRPNSPQKKPASVGFENPKGVLRLLRIARDMNTSLVDPSSFAPGASVAASERGRRWIQKRAKTAQY